MTRPKRVNPFDPGTAERVLFDRYRKAAAEAARLEQEAGLLATEASAKRTAADRYAEALRALGHGDKVPGQAARPEPVEGVAPDPERERLRCARILARKMAARDRIVEQLRQADAEVHAAFGPFAAGRCISLEEAREQLTSIGYLKRRRVWE